MIAHTLVAIAALAAAQQVRDAATTARDAYTACLREFMQASLRDRMAQDAFDAALPQQCAAQLSAFREALRAREVGFRTPAGEIDEILNQEVEDARANMRETYAMNLSSD